MIANLTRKGTIVPFFILYSTLINAQNPLFIPDTLSGKSITLTVQSGSKQFIGNTSTPTYGYNGPMMGPTIFLNKDDSVTLNVKNMLNQPTTVHWHGLHVSPQNDGGPHQIIASNTTWSPSFKVRNEASTFWYHPHGEGKTEIQVTRGLAGLLIVRDNLEKTYTLPRRYKVDDFPIIVQSKAFDVLYQFATANHEDSVVMVNGTMNPYLQVPQQVVRLRLLNGSSDRTYNFGLSDNSNFYQIGSDGGLLSQPFQTNRLRLSVGERAEILVNLTSYSVGTQLYLMSYASELPRGIIGADSVGTATVVIGEGYYSNPLNGADFNLLRLDVVAQTTNPVTTIFGPFAPKVPLSTANVDANRHIHFSGDTVMSGPAGNVDGPFLMNNTPFHMDSVNVVTYLNNKEIWMLTNETMVAHPFHIHDIQFFVLDINGSPPPPGYAGLKDVVLVQPKDTVRFITRFETFADPHVPYMFHCHLLHHEDDGMMGSFLVLDPAAMGISEKAHSIGITAYPNPSETKITFQTNDSNSEVISSVTIRNTLGQSIYSECGLNVQKHEVSTDELPAGIFIGTVTCGNQSQNIKFLKN
jgi:blue copper oxidase